MGQTVIRGLLMNPRRSYQAEPKPDKRIHVSRVPLDNPLGYQGVFTNVYFHRSTLADERVQLLQTIPGVGRKTASPLFWIEGEVE